MFGIKYFFVRFVMVNNMVLRVRRLLIGVIPIMLMISIRLPLVRLLVRRRYGILNILWTKLRRLIVLFDLNIMMLVESRPTLLSM